MMGKSKTDLNQQQRSSPMYVHYRLCERINNQLQKLSCTNQIDVEINEHQQAIKKSASSQNLELNQSLPQTDGELKQDQKQPQQVLKSSNSSFELSNRKSAALAKSFLINNNDIDYKWVKNWASSYENVKKCSTARQLFAEFLKNENLHENINFLDDLARNTNNYEKYVGKIVCDENELQSATKTNAFDQIAKKIDRFLAEEIYPKFVESNDYKDYVLEYIPLIIIQSWESCYEVMMKYDEGRSLFMKFLQEEHCEELLQFWEKAQYYVKISNSATRLKMAEEIFQKFISEQSDAEISVESEVKHQISKEYKSAEASLFLEAEKQAYVNLKRNYFTKFAKSDILQTFIKNQLQKAKEQCAQRTPISTIMKFTTDFDILLTHDVGRILFGEFMKLEISDENIRFWEAVQVFKMLDRNSEDNLNWAKQRAREIFKEYMSEESTQEINIDDSTRRKVVKFLNSGDKETFSAAERHIYNLMQRDSFPKFIRSDVCKLFLETQFQAQKDVLPLKTMRTWAFDFDSLMQYEYGRYLFAKFLEKDKCDENIRFWEAVQAYKSQNEQHKRKALGYNIFAEFVSTEAVKEVNIDSASRKEAKKGIETGDVKAFDLAEKHICHLMEFDSYPKFLKSQIFADFKEDLIHVEVKHLSKEDLQRWATDFDYMLEFYAGRELFVKFLQMNHADENMRFLNEVRIYKEIATGSEVSNKEAKLRKKSRQIYSDFISNESGYVINISGGKRDFIKKHYEKGDPDLYNLAEQEITYMLKRDNFARFVKSEIFVNFMQSNQVPIVSNM